MTQALPTEILEAILNSASDAILVTEESRKIVFFNAQAELLFGYTSNDVLGKDLNTLIPARLAEVHNQHVGDFIAGSVDRRDMSERPELLARRRDGSEFPVEITISKVATSSGVYSTALVRDVTRRKLIEQEMQRKTELLLAANEELKRLSEIKNQFLGMATHDLRNPLVTLRNGAEMLLEDHLTDDQRSKLLRIIHSGAESMLLLVSDLLDINRIESGRLELHKTQVDCRTYLEEIREYHLLTAQKKNISLVLNIEDSVGSVRFDPKRIQQVLENLLSNAIKFSTNGTTVTITVAVRGQNLEISVRDQGVGIPQAEIPKLFGAFRQLSTRATAGEKGTGLGLVIAKKIIELHGGTINVTSTEGSGSEFIVVLPV